MRRGRGGGEPAPAAGTEERAERIAAFLCTDRERIQELEREVVRKHLAAGRTVALLAGQVSAGYQMGNLGKEFKAEKLTAWTCPFNWPSWSQNKPTWELYRITLATEAVPPSP